MCIRDRVNPRIKIIRQIVPLEIVVFCFIIFLFYDFNIFKNLLVDSKGPMMAKLLLSCLLYTSDAADERSSVDLGGRRIIKKKKNVK